MLAESAVVVAQMRVCVCVCVMANWLVRSWLERDDGSNSERRQSRLGRCSGASGGVSGSSSSSNRSDESKVASGQSACARSPKPSVLAAPAQAMDQPKVSQRTSEPAATK